MAENTGNENIQDDHLVDEALDRARICKVSTPPCQTVAASHGCFIDKA